MLLYRMANEKGRVKDTNVFGVVFVDAVVGKILVIKWAQVFKKQNSCSKNAAFWLGKRIPDSLLKKMSLLNDPRYYCQLCDRINLKIRNISILAKNFIHLFTNRLNRRFYLFGKIVTNYLFNSPIIDSG